MKKWDEQLAMGAKRWADQCRYGNDVCRDVGEYLLKCRMSKFKKL